MLNTKLFKLLRHLSSEEMKAVKVYLNSKHNRAAKAFRLFDYIDKNRHDLEKNKAKFTKEKIYKHVYGKEAYNRGKMQELASRLLKEIEFYLIMNEVEQDELLHDVLLSKVLKKKGMDDIFKLHNDKSQKKIRKTKNLEHRHYHALARLSSDATFHRDTPKLNTDYDLLLTKAEEYLDMEYILDKLKMLCERTTMKGIVQSKDNAGRMIPIDFEHLKKNMKDDTLAYLYLTIIEMYDKDSVELYEQLKKKILTNNLSLSSEIIYDLCGFLINFCLRKYKNNKAQYITELFEIYEYLITNDLIFEDNYISESHFMNAITVAVGMQAYSSAERNLKLSQKLKPEYQSSGKALGNAILHFARKEYGEVIACLQQIEMKDIFHKLTARSLLIRSYYELGEWTVLKNYIKAGKRFIERKKTIAPTTGIANLNFYNFVAELIKYNEKPSPNATTILREKLEQDNMIHIKWSEQKIRELEEKMSDS